MSAPGPIRLAGYAGLFDIPDADRDTIRKGAFSATLAQRTDPLPLLWQHRPDQQIGTVESVVEDERGLRVIARIDRSASRAAHSGEFYVNQSLTMIDALMQNAVEDLLLSPPASPSDGDCYLVAQAASDEWSGKDDQIALRITGAWQYVMPTDRMLVLNRATGQNLIYSSGWSAAIEPAEPTGGAVIDTEARSAISSLIQALRIANVFPG